MGLGTIRGGAGIRLSAVRSVDLLLASCTDLGGSGVMASA